MFLACNLNDFEHGGVCPEKQRNELFGFHFKGKRQVTARIPFEIYSNLIIIKVRVDESDTLNFIFDTGVSSFIITDQTIAKN